MVYIDWGEEYVLFLGMCIQSKGVKLPKPQFKPFLVVLFGNIDRGDAKTEARIVC